MSRSNPTINTPNPATRWLQWKGGDDFGLYFYDKEKKANVKVKIPFTFMLLEQLAAVTGYNNKLKTGLRSNVVRDTSEESLVVKYGTGATVASGHWSEIKDRVKGAGGKFCAHVYGAYKTADGLQICVLQMSGCALGPWFDFVKANRGPVDNPFKAGDKLPKMYSGAIVMEAGAVNSEGPIPFTPPTFRMTACTAETNTLAIALDRELQAYFDEYFKRPKTEQATTAAAHHEEEAEPEAELEPDPLDPVDDDQIPF